jgi:hypothetical protein
MLSFYASRSLAPLAFAKESGPWRGDIAEPPEIKILFPTYVMCSMDRAQRPWFICGQPQPGRRERRIGFHGPGTTNGPRNTRGRRRMGRKPT